MAIPMAHEIYKHFKGNLYQVLAVAIHSETGEQLVVYQALYGEFKIYARPLEMFLSKVDKIKYPDVKQEYRFELQNGNSTTHTFTEVLKDDVNEEELQLDPLVLEFLDANTHEERLNILAALRHKITDDMITTMAIACDIEVMDGDIEKRYSELKNCLITLGKFEIKRLI